MNKKIALVMILLVSGMVAFAQMSALSPKDARSMGMGGTFAAFSSGYSSFFGNPAGYAARGSLTIADVATWMYVKPTEANIAKIRAFAEGASDSQIRSDVSDFITSNGFGGGAAAGLGWTGGGFALGAFVVTDEYVYGTSLLGSKVMSSSSANAVIGLGLSLINAKNLKLHFGVDVRPFFRIDSLGSGWGFTDLLNSALDDGGDVMATLRAQNITSGYGLAMDFGAQLAVGPLMFGVSARDIAPAFKTGTSSVGDFLDRVFPSFSTDSTLKPQIAAGLGLALKPLPGVIETNLYAEMKDALAVIQDRVNPFTRLHAGMDLKVLNFVTLRGGINSGYYSVGAGIDLAILEIDAAAFTEELGIKAGDNPRSGVALQVALRL